MSEHTKESFEQATFVKPIDMAYDFEYDNQPTDSKNMPVPLKEQLAAQVGGYLVEYEH